MSLSNDTSQDTQVNPLEMSDDEFLNSLPRLTEQSDTNSTPNQGGDGDANGGGTTDSAAVVDTAAGNIQPGGTSGTSGEDENHPAASGAVDPLGSGTADAGAETQADAGTAAQAGNPAAGADQAAAEGAAQESKDPPLDGKAGEADQAGTDAAPDYKALYEQIMAPFQANGRKVELKSPDEVLKLMQMGANYTRKLQELAPHRKVMLMLQNNDLLDENKLSFLIDLDKKNPEAIKKLIKDAGIDPMDIDTSTDPLYLGGSHAVTDEEANFRTTLDELAADPAGKETLSAINTTWDQTSKDALWASPEIMTIIHQQRENGIYDAITTEIDRQRTLGQIPPNTPFLEAYKTVGDAMAAASLAAHGRHPGTSTAAEQAGIASPPQPVATKVVAPKSPLANGSQANAASPTRSAPTAVKQVTNPLAMSDEDFLKQMNGRV